MLVPSWAKGLAGRHDCHSDANVPLTILLAQDWYLAWDLSQESFILDLELFFKFSRHFKDALVDSRPFSHDYDDDYSDNHSNDNEILFVSRLSKDGSVDSRSTSLSLLPSRLARGQCCYSTRLRGLVMIKMLRVMVAVMVILMVLIMKNKLWWWCWSLWQL